MCEPTHSISQWTRPEIITDVVTEVVSTLPAADTLRFLQEELSGSRQLPAALDSDDITDEVCQWFIDDHSTELERLQLFVGEDARNLSAIGRFYHLSRFGEGHLESRTAKLGKSALVPPYTAYEVLWWARQIKFDDDSSTSKITEESSQLLTARRNHQRTILYRRISDALRREALLACEKYANITSIGTPQVLRRFLEETIMTTKKPQEYREPLNLMFSKKGLREFESRLALAGVPTTLHVSAHAEEIELRSRLAKIVCGLTRIRGYMCPEWGDVERMWQKNSAQ